MPSFFVGLLLLLLLFLLSPLTLFSLSHTHTTNIYIYISQPTTTTTTNNHPCTQHQLLLQALGAGGTKLYAAPYKGQYILEIDPVSKTATRLRSKVGTPVEKFRSGFVAGADSNILYASPGNNQGVLQFNSSSKVAQWIAIEGLPGSAVYTSSSSSYRGALTLSPDTGRMYTAPYKKGGYVLEVDTSGTAVGNPATARLLPHVGGGAPFPGNAYVAAPTLARNGKLYVPPSDATHVLEIDPYSQMSRFIGSSLGSATTKKYYAPLAAAPWNGRLYSAPYNGNRILEVRGLYLQPSDACSRDDACIVGSICVTHCCKVTEGDEGDVGGGEGGGRGGQGRCSTGCGAVDGSCYPGLFLEQEKEQQGQQPTVPAWGTDQVDALGWPSTLIKNEPIILSAPDNSVIKGKGGAAFRRKGFVDGTITEEKEPVDDAGKLEYTLRWERPKLRENSNSNSNNNNNNNGNGNSNADATYLQDVIGKPPPSNLVEKEMGAAADNVFPGGLFYVDPSEGVITGAPKVEGNYTLWLLLEDTRGASVNDEKLSKEFDQTVVAVWTFEVTDKPKSFQVLEYERAVGSKYDPQKYTSTKSPTLDCIVGSSYSIAPIEQSTLKTEGAALAGVGRSQLQFTMKGAPDGFFLNPNSGEILAVPTTPTMGAGRNVIGDGGSGIGGVNDTKASSSLPHLGGGPVNITLYAVDAAGAEAYLETITVRVSPTPELSLVLEGGGLRTQNRSDARFTFPEDRARLHKNQYYVGDTYRIAPLKLDTEKTDVSAGTIHGITYTLVDAPEGWFISAGNGEITGQFERPGMYNLTTHVIDEGGQQSDLESLTFNVVKRELFEIISYERAPSASRQLEPDDYTTPTPTTSYSVGKTYRFAGIVVKEMINTDDLPEEASVTTPPNHFVFR